jgi:uncharacterized Tic20 family protein
MNLAEELERLEALKQRGALSEEEYTKAKDSLLRKSEPISEKINAAMNQVSSDTNFWCMLIHLTQFCGYLLPLAGLVVPIILWQVKKDQSPVIDRHGRVVMNWILSALIYLGISILLSFVFIGFPMLWILGLLAIVFPIIGGVKANGGELWIYPGSIRFFSVP